MEKETKEKGTGTGTLSRDEWIKRERAFVQRFVRDGEAAQRLAEQHYSGNRVAYEKLRGIK